MKCILDEVFHIFFIDCEKSKKTQKKLLPQKMARSDTLSPNKHFSIQSASQLPPSKLQIDKMSQNEIF